MKIIIIGALLSITSMLTIDAVWLKIMFPKFYNQQIGYLLSETPKLVPAGIFYLIFATALSIFVIVPAISNNHSLIKVFLLGGLFGLAAYATYDLTNHSTIRDWPLIVTVVDMIWGTLLTGSVSVFAVIVTKYFL